MPRRGGIDGWKRGIRVFALSAAALVLAMLLGAPAIADKVPPGWAQWDYWGRSRPLPVYALVWSADDGVCKRIVKALNGAGPSPASLYGDPIFLRWQRYQADMRIGQFDETFGEWTEVPFFNDGKAVVAFRLIIPSARFIDEYLLVFDDVQYFQALKPDPLLERLSNPHLLRPLDPFLGRSYKTFIALPKTMKDYRYWSLMGLGSDVEINIAELDGTAYSVMRMPSIEVTLVLFFSADREGHAVCVISPKRPPG